MIQSQDLVNRLNKEWVVLKVCVKHGQRIGKQRRPTCLSQVLNLGVGCVLSQINIFSKLMWIILNLRVLQYWRIEASALCADR